MAASLNSTAEEERIAALEHFSILDSEKERTFDLITELVARMLSVPHACVALVDRERAWFKSTFGIEATQVKREPGFCATLVGSTEEVRHIEDASLLPETIENTLVQGELRIRFYAGAPLCTTEGHRIGTLCAFGPEPRGLTTVEEESLRSLATLVMHEIDRRKARNELARTEQALRDAHRLDSLGLVASGVAHDFNNLLCAILGNTELLRDELEGVPRVAELLAEIENTGRRASELAGQVLAYAGGGDAPMAATDLNALVLESYRMTRGAIESHCRVEFDLEQGLRPVRGQSTGLRQLIVNLLTNAVEACEAVGGTVRLATKATPSRVCLSVSDDGCGMSEPARQRAFEPFFSSKSKGRGLGLSICKRIVEQHAGKIEIDSRAERGTTLRVWLPSLEAEPAPAAPRRGPASTCGKRELVLVVDDESSVCRMIQLCLEKAGFTVLLAGGGQEAIDLLGTRAADIRVVVLDWSMPLVNGGQVLEAMQRRGLEIPVVLSSGHSDVGAHASSPLVRYFLKKPYPRAELVECVRSAVCDEASRTQGPS